MAPGSLLKNNMANDVLPNLEHLQISESPTTSQLLQAFHTHLQTFHIFKKATRLFFFGIKTESQTISIKTTTNLTMFPNINFQKYQLSKTEIFHNLVGVLLIYVSFRKDF